MTQRNDGNPEETREWLDALNSVIEVEGIERAHYILGRLSEKATRSGGYTPSSTVNTSYRNTISPLNEERMPGDMFMERQIRGIIRWNALAMVMRANKHNPISVDIYQHFLQPQLFMMLASIIFFVVPMIKMKAT